MGEQKQKMFHYKVAQYVKDGANDLENSLNLALRRCGSALSRREALFSSQSSDSGAFRLINRHDQHLALYCGEFFSYTHGLSKHLVGLDGGALELPLYLVAPEVLDQEFQSEFVDSPLFFGVSRNHVLLAGSSNMNTKQFERHINWLLREATNTIDRHEHVLLSDPTPNFGNQEYRQVQSVTISSELNLVEDEIKPSERSGELFTSNAYPRGNVWEAIKSLLVDAGVQVPDVNLKGNVSREQLETTLEIKQKDTRYTKSSTLMDSIANAFRHTSDAPVKIRFRDGSTIEGQSFKVTKSFSVESANGIPDMYDVFTKMNEWFAELMQSEQIDPD